jgi:hypothetical protein
MEIVLLHLHICVHVRSTRTVLQVDSSYCLVLSTLIDFTLVPNACKLGDEIVPRMLHNFSIIAEAEGNLSEIHARNGNTLCHFLFGRCQQGNHFLARGVIALVLPRFCIDLVRSLALRVRCQNSEWTGLEQARDVFERAKSSFQEQVKGQVAIRVRGFGTLGITINQIFNHFQRGRLHRDVQTSETSSQCKVNRERFLHIGVLNATRALVHQELQNRQGAAIQACLMYG